jgi:hypothetical protein
MAMNRLFTLRTLFAVLLGALTWLGAETSQAQVTNHSGLVCKNSSFADASYIEYQQNGVRSRRNSMTGLTCPLTRAGNDANGAFIYVDVKHSANASTSCGAYSWDYQGNLIASADQTWTGSGFHEFTLNLVGPGKSQAWSDYSVVCYLAGNLVGTLMGIDLAEQ